MKTRNYKPEPHKPSKLQDPPQGFKRCTACTEVLPFHCYNVNRRSKDGYTARCSPCRKITQRYKRNPTKFHPIELPVAICNEAVIDRLQDQTKYNYSCRGGFTLVIDFTRSQKKINISHGDTTVIDMDFQEADLPTVLYWIKQYLFDNQIWIVPE